MMALNLATLILKWCGQSAEFVVEIREEFHLQADMSTAISPTHPVRLAKLPISTHEAGLGSVELAVLGQADRHGRTVLVLPDDAELLDEVTGSRARTDRAVASLRRAGWLLRVRRGTYVVRTRAGSLDRGALAMIGDITRHPHLVTSGGALSRAGLSDQAFRSIIVLTAHPQRPWSWLGESVRYLRVRPGALWGGRSYSDSGSTKIARPSRAILDSISHPHWGVSLPEIAKALQKEERLHPEFVDDLAVDAARFGNSLASRRLGFIVERLDGREAARPFLPLRGRSKAIVPLLSVARSLEGPIDTTWRLRINVDMQLLFGDLDVAL
jgi:predicted transcriptional regulator of viral defense system